MILFDINGEIIPGKCIGDFQIGWTYEKLISKNLIQRDFTNKHMPDNVIHEVNGNIVMFINERKEIQEIVAMNNYKGKVNGLFGIGDKLIDFKEQVKYETSIYDANGFFYFHDMPGLRVINNSWDEEGKYPIERIYVYDTILGSEF